MENKRIILIVLGLILFATFYSQIDNFLKEEFEQIKFAKVERVIDGDTIIAEGQTIRLLGINTPEKGEKYYNESRFFLEKEILNKTVELKFGKEKKDLYNRTLAYIFIADKNINQEMISNGFANAYFSSGKDYYFPLFLKTWKSCVEREINYCAKSKNICANCIILKELDYEKQKVTLKNICGISCNLTKWKIKDEGRKKFVFPEFILEPNKEISIIVGKNKIEGVLIWEREDYVWTKAGDTLFLRDPEDKLILWYNY
jgi:micrococcal nuclease